MGATLARCSKIDNSADAGDSRAARTLRATGLQILSRPLVNCVRQDGWDLLLIKREPDRREGSVAKLANDGEPTILKNVSDMNRVEMARTIGFNPLCGCSDWMESVLRRI